MSEGSGLQPHPSTLNSALPTPSQPTHCPQGSSPLAHQPNSSPLACGGAAVEGSGSSFNYAGTRSANQSRAPRKRASNLFAVAVRGGGPGGLQEEGGEDDDLAEMKQVGRELGT